jgi:hypothetical protein
MCLVMDGWAITCLCFLPGMDTFSVPYLPLAFLSIFSSAFIYCSLRRLLLQNVLFDVLSTRPSHAHTCHEDSTTTTTFT